MKITFMCYSLLIEHFQDMSQYFYKDEIYGWTTEPLYELIRCFLKINNLVFLLSR